MKSAKGTDIIQPDTIKQKELFYSLENESEINRLTNALKDENLFNIQIQLVEKGYQKGIAALLYGAPGTGKTETVYQIAKKTERSILDLIRKVGDLCDSSEEMFEKTFQTEAIEYKYCDFDFVKKVKLLFPDDINTRLFFYGCCNDLLKGYASSLQSTIECSYDESDRFQIAESFMEGNHPLLKMDLVEFVDKSNLTESTITAKAKEMFLGENAKL